MYPAMIARRCTDSPVENVPLIGLLSAADPKAIQPMMKEASTRVRVTSTVRIRPTIILARRKRLRGTGAASR